MGARITSSNRGNRISAISAKGLSRKQLKTSAWGFCSLRDMRRAERSAHTPAGIVRYVQNPVDGRARNSLQPSGPARLTNPLGDRGRRNGKPVICRQFHGRGNGQCNVSVLVRAGQR